MTYRTFVVSIVGEGVDALERAIVDGDKGPREAGALTGYDACVQCESAPELGILLAFARNKHTAVIGEPLPDADQCVFSAGFVGAVEWVCNCVSALLLNEGLQALTRPTSRGILKCAELLGVAPGGIPRTPLWFLRRLPARPIVCARFAGARLTSRCRSCCGCGTGWAAGWNCGRVRATRVRWRFSAGSTDR